MTTSATRYSTAFAHVVSAGASLWAFRRVGISYFSVGSFGIFLLSSAIGIVTFGELKPHIQFVLYASEQSCMLQYSEVCGLLFEFFYKICEYDGVNSLHHRSRDIL